jgi:excisionase family DNA binding protein|tara:strand:+ start:500 stop:667 length:168 start_codon:yes stop_codon:yes gene_type:complete
MNKLKTLLSVSEVSERIGISAYLVKQEIQKGKLKATQYGKSFYIHEEDFNKYVNH